MAAVPTNKLYLVWGVISYCDSKQWTYRNTYCLKEVLVCRDYHIYIIITKNIRYLLWNRGFWCSLNNIYPIFLTLCIWCTNYLCGSCDLTEVNPHFIPSLLQMIENVDLLWRQELAASHCDVTMTHCSRVVAMDAFLAQWNRKFITAQWSTEITSCFNFFVYLFIFNFVTPCLSTWGIASSYNSCHCVC